MKQLIIFYSFERNTKFIAQEIQKLTNANILELKVKNDIKTHGFLKYVWGRRRVLMKKTPELENYDKNFNDYDRIFIGSPVWVSTYAPAIRTFLKDNKIIGRELVFFACFDGDEAKVFENLKSELKNNKILGTIGFKEALKNKEESIKNLNEFMHKIGVLSAFIV
ncbi:MAG: flavodoxin [Patescibacteria group bacterium]|nr:flavodoxin [Patescibacteria group bacterium]